MDKTKVLFRADGNSEIGLGHVIRSLALLDMISGSFDCSFYTLDPSPFIENEINKYCSNLVVMDNESDFLQKVKAGQLVILDGYRFAGSYMQEIVNKGAKLMYIDDLHDRHYPAHVIINQSPDAESLSYDKAPYTKVFCGLEYALLRAPFLAKTGSTKRTNEFKKLLITLGGADPLNLSQIIADAALNTGLFDSITVIEGPLKKEKITASGITNVLTGLSADEMATLMFTSDLMFGSASSVTIEALATRLPVICGYYEKNQEDFYRYLSTNQAVFGAGNLREASTASVRHLFQSGVNFFRSGESKALIDGKQPERYIKIVKDLLYE